MPMTVQKLCSAAWLVSLAGWGLMAADPATAQPLAIGIYTTYPLRWSLGMAVRASWRSWSGV